MVARVARHVAGLVFLLLLVALPALAQGDPIPNEPGLPVDPTIILIGAILPLITALFKQSGLTKEANSVIAIAVYVGACLLYMVQQQIPFTIEAFSQNAAAIFGIGFIAYKMVWDALGVDASLTAATSIRK